MISNGPMVANDKLSPSGAPVASIREVCKSFGKKRVLQGVSLDLAPGRVTALLARNGAGKTTLISIIAGRLRACSGEVAVCGRAVHGRDAAVCRNLGVAPQDIGFYPDLSVGDNVRFAARCYRMKGKALRLATEESLELLGLSDLLQAPARTLSGGQKRRLHTAMAIVHRPPLLLLDEPTVGSDPQARNYIVAAVRQLAAEGAAVLYTSHYFPEIEALHADVAVLHEGRICEHASVNQLLLRHGRRGLCIRLQADDRSAGFVLPDELAEAFRLRGLSSEEERLWRSQGSLTIVNRQPEELIGELLPVFTSVRERIAGWELVNPDLESVFLQLTESNYVGGCLDARLVDTLQRA